MRKLFELSYQYQKFNTMALVALSMTKGAIQFFALLYSGHAIDSVVKNRENTTPIIVTYILLLLGSLIIQPLISLVQRNISIVCKSKVEESVGEEIRHHSVEEIESEHFQKSLNQHLQIPIEFDKSLPLLSERIVNLVKVTAIAVLIASQDFIILAVYLVFVVLSAAFKKRQNSATHDIWVKYRERIRKYSFLSRIMIDKEHAHERVLFNTTDKLNYWFSESFDVARRENSLAGRKRMTFDVFVEIVGKIIVFITYLIWARILLTGNLSLGLFFVLIGNTVLLQEIIGAELSKETDFNNFEEAEKKFKKFIQNSHGAQDAMAKDLFNFRFGESTLVFDGVNFKYPHTDNMVIRDFNFTFSSGKTYVIVGKNGAGKSTLAKLLTGLYKPISGRVMLNGEEICKMPDPVRSEIFAAVFQSPNIYPLTLKDNITIGNIKNLGEEKEIIESLERIDKDLVASIAKLPYGINSDVNVNVNESQAINLSGGQWQKIFFARLDQSDSPILILDEPTSSLDPLAEVKLYENITNQLNADMNVLISHRLGIVRLADQILVIEDGQLLENGTHAELMEEKGLYYEMYQSQKLLYSYA